MNKLLYSLFLGLLSGVLQAQDTVSVEFGPLYNYAHEDIPTTIEDGTGTLGTALTGQSVTWWCLQLTAASPDEENQPLDYYVGTDQSVLSTGYWSSSITDVNARSSILSAITNMYYTYESEILANTTSDGSNNQPGSAFQTAIWYLTEGYYSGIYSGTLDSDDIASLISWNGGDTGMLETESNSWVSAMLNAALDGAGAGKTAYFLDQGGSTDLQTLVIFTIPEPSSAVLIGLGIVTFTRRRRKL